MKKHWWKALGVLLILFSIVQGLLSEVPAMDILNETIRNLYYHVPMWFAMVAMLVGSLVHSITYLSKGNRLADTKAAETMNVALFLGAMGLLTGMIWGNYTWGKPWVNDPKMNGVAIGMLIYFAYQVLRAAIDDEEKRARVAAVFNVFAFPIFIVLIFILPRLNVSIHPGNGGNPGFNSYDLDNRMRVIFYSAVTGWILVGFWIANLRTRLKQLEEQEDEQ